MFDHRPNLGTMKCGNRWVGEVYSREYGIPLNQSKRTTTDDIYQSPPQVPEPV